MRKGDKQYTDYSLNSLKLINVGPKLHFEVDSNGTLMDSLVAFWKLDEAGNGRHDVLGKNHLTDNNRVSAADGKKGNAGHFTRARSQYLSIADNADLSVGDLDFSISAWVYLDSEPAASTMSIVGKYKPSATESREYYLRHNTSTDKFEFIVSNDGSTTAEVATAAGVSTGTWYFLFCYHDASANEIGISLNNGTPNTTAHSTGVFNGTANFVIGATHDATLFWDGRIDDVGIWKKVLSSTERTDLYNSGNGNTVTGGDWPLEQFSTDSSGELLRDLVAYWKLDENIPASGAATTRYDSVGLNHLTDNATVTEAGGIRGQAGQFTAANSEYLSIADNADLSTGDIDFTWAGWLWVNDLATQYAFVSKDTEAAGGREYHIVFVPAADKVRFDVFDGTTVIGQVTSTEALQANTFHFVLAYHDAGGNVVGIQIDNNAAATSATTGAPGDTATAVNVGRKINNTEALNGRIDEVGFWKRILTSAEKTDLYNSGAGQTITDQNKTNNKRFKIDTNGTLLTDLKAYWKLDENAGTRYDEIGENNLTDVATVTQTYGIKSFAGQFVRANSEYLSVGDNPDLSMGDIDFSIAAWLYLDSEPAASEMYAIAKGNPAGGTGQEYLVYYNTTADRFRVALYNGTTETIVTANNFGAPTTGTWYFFVVTYNAATDTLSISVNNGTADTASHSGGAQDQTNDFNIGRTNHATPRHWDGRIDEVGVWKKVLTSQERTDLYNSGIGNTVIKDEVL